MFKDRLQKFSIRKLTVGAASVLIGTATALFVDSNDSVAKADTKPVDPQSTESTGKTTNVTEQTNLNIVSSSEVQKNTEGTNSTDSNNLKGETPADPTDLNDSKGQAPTGPSNPGDSNKNKDEKGRLPFDVDGNENRPFVSPDTHEQIGGTVQDGKNNAGNIIVTTSPKNTNDLTFTEDNYVESNIYLVNSDNTTYTVYIYMPNIIPSDKTEPEQAKQDVLKFVGQNLLTDYNNNYKDSEAFKNDYDNLLKTGKLIKIDSIYEGRYSRVDKDDKNVKNLIASDNTGITIDDSNVNDAYDAYGKISEKLKEFFDVEKLSSLNLAAYADDGTNIGSNDDPNDNYPGQNQYLLAGAHGEYVQQPANNAGGDAGLDYPDTPNTTPDTPNTTPDTPNTDNNGDQGKEPNNSNKGDNDKQDHGNKGTGSATSNNTNTGRNEGSVTKLNNSGAGSNKSVNGNDNELPQTGEKENSMASVFGLAAIALGGLMGLAGDRKKKRN